MDVDRKIREKFRIKRRDNLPYAGWRENTRKDLADLFGELGYKYGAEIGVERGLNAKTLFESVPGLKLICVDPWCGFSRSTDDERADRFFKTAKKVLQRHDVEWMKMTSMEAVQKVPDLSLDFVYIDGMHDFDHVMMDIICWSRKVRAGGIVSGHDYIPLYQVGVIRAVDAYTLAHNITDWYITRDYDPAPSWFWVKQDLKRGVCIT